MSPYLGFDFQIPGQVLDEGPRLPVTLSFAGEQVTVIALLDSGASISVFHTAVAEALRIDLAAATAESFAPFGGGDAVELKLASVWVQIGHTIRVPAWVGFTDRIDEDAGILGRESVFEVVRFAIDFPEARVLYHLPDLG